MVTFDDISETTYLWLSQGRQIALATVVETWGSAPRRAGAQMVIDAAGDMAGSVSGGCVEAAVVVEAQDAIRTGQSKRLEYGVSDSNAFAAGLACGGTIRILIQPVGTPEGLAAESIETITEAKAQRQAVVAVTDLTNFQTQVHAPQSAEEREAVRLDRSAVQGDQFICVFNPPLRLVIFGAVHIAQNLAPMAAMNSFTPSIVDPRAQFLSEARFPQFERVEGYASDYADTHQIDARTAIVALSHDEKIDDPALALALRSKAFYIGALGSKRTHAKRCERLEAQGFSTADIARIHAPIGLPIGASSPSEIATAIMAEIIAELRGVP